MSGGGRESDWADLRPARRVLVWSLLVWSGLALAALALGPRAAAGVAVGGGIVLGSFAIHMGLARAWLGSERRRRARFYLWALWLVKWPLIAAILYVSIRTGFASPLWVCVGTAVVPLMATATAIRTLRLLRPGQRSPKGAV